MQRLVPVLTVGSALLVTACGGSNRDVRFPTQDELSELIAENRPLGSSVVEVDAVDAWTFSALRDHVGFEPTPLPAAAAGIADLQTNAHPHTAGLQCVAEEVAAYYTREGKFPPSELQAIFAAWCGASTGNPGGYAISFSDGQRDAALRDLADELRSRWPDDAAFGVAITDDGFGGGQAVAVYGSVGIALDRIPVAVGANEIVVTGSVDDRAEEVRGYATLGDTSAATCERDTSVPLPAFRLTCPLDPADADAMISVHSRERDRVLFSHSVIARVSPSGSASSDWVLQTPRLEDGAAFDDALLTQLNAWRAAAGLDPLRFETAQSQTIEDALPIWFADDVDDRTRDQLALGLIAGWDVPTPIMNGGLSGQFASNGAGADVVVGYLLSEPFARHLLLDPEVDAVAFASASVNAFDARGLLVTGYTDFHGIDAREAEEALFNRLVAERAARGNTETEVLPRQQARIVRNAADRITEADRPPHRAVRTALSNVVNVSQQAARSYVWSNYYSIDGIAFPDDLLDAESLEISIGVGIYAPDDTPWPSYGVLVVYR